MEQAEWITAVLEIIKQQNEILKLLATPQIIIPADSGINLEDLK